MLVHLQQMGMVCIFQFLFWIPGYGFALSISIDICYTAVKEIFLSLLALL